MKNCIISPDAEIGENTKIWHFSHVREGAVIGSNCIIGKNCYIDKDVTIGNNVKIQNNVSLYKGVVIEDEVFIGPHVCFTNDKFPRSTNVDGTLKTETEWDVLKTFIKKGASVGANSTILPGITVGKYALIGAGSTVTKNIQEHALVFGNPAEVKGFICRCGSSRVELSSDVLECNRCGTILKLKK